MCRDTWTCVSKENRKDALQCVSTEKTVQTHGHASQQKEKK